MRLQERVKLLDVVHPESEPPMNEFREVFVRGRSELEQVLALQIALAALARDRGDELCKYTQSPAVREQANSHRRCSAVLCVSDTSGVRPWGQRRLGPWPEERPEFAKPVAPPIDVEDLDIMEEPIQDRRGQDLILRKDGAVGQSRTCLFDVSTMLPRSYRADTRRKKRFASVRSNGRNPTSSMINSPELK